MSAEQMYYVLSLKWTKRREALITFWAFEDNGYRYRLEQCQKYTATEIAAHPDHYDDGESTLAVPCSDVDALAITVAEADSDELDSRDRQPTDHVVRWEHLIALKLKADCPAKFKATKQARHARFPWARAVLS